MASPPEAYQYEHTGTGRGRSAQAAPTPTPTPTPTQFQFQFEREVPDETKECVPFESVRRATVNHPNSDEICQSSSDDCPVCCRVFEWLVCDRDNVLTHLQCVCNSGSIAPSSAPFEPSRSPTSKPSSSPSKRIHTSEPSVPPSPAPSTDPTLSPTATPSTLPTSGPSDAPSSNMSEQPTLVISSTPTFEPSQAVPVLQPTGAGTFSPVSTQFVTQRVEDESGDLVRSTSCLMPPDNTQTIVRATYTFQYELSVSNAIDPWGALASNYFHEQIHDAVVEEFFRCTFQEDDLWIYVSSPHIIDTDLNCEGSIPVSQSCFVVSAMESIWVYDAPGPRTRRLQSSAASEFAAEISSFIEDAMDRGTFTGNGDVSNLVYLGFPAGSPPMDPKPSLMPTSNPTSTPGSSDKDIHEEFPQLTSDASGSVKNSGLSTAGIAILSTMGVVSAIILFLVLKRRCARDQRRYYEKDGIGIVIDNAATTSFEENAENDSVPDGIMSATGTGTGTRSSLLGEEEDPYTSASPPRRSRRGPLYSQDELDMTIGDRIASYASFEPPRTQRKGIATDTVNL